MASEVKLPRLGQGMEAGTIVKWLKDEGDRVEKGEPLYELDTDKVTQEVEADVGGVLLKIALREGEAPVGRIVAWIGEEGEEVAEEPESPAAETCERSSAEPNFVRESRAAAPAPTFDAGDRVKASPLARRIARERGIDLHSLTGTGPDGRIVAEDVERAAAGGPRPAAPVAAAPTGEVESVPLSSVRKTIARRLTAAWQAPVFQLTMRADTTRTNELVARARELYPEVRITVTDVLAKVCAQALMLHRDVNVQFAEDALLRFPSADVGIAVAAPQGLVVPVVHGVERLSLAEVAAARADVVERARGGKLTSQDLDGGTFTISNLGMFGVEEFVAVLNPPQATILAVGAAVETPVVRDGEVVVRPLLALTLTVDHRAVDGAEGAAFLRTVKQFVEDPALAL